MDTVAVITGGAGGMGAATARLLGQTHHVVITDVNQERLDATLASLRESGISCSAVTCDITDRTSVDELVRYATGVGTVSAVVHTAGISPQMAPPDVILRVNALGTINVTDAFYEIAHDGFVLVNVASMAAHMAPPAVMPTRAYRYALTDPATFLRKASFRARLMPNDFYRKGMAYSISKHFVIWYSKKNAVKFGEKGARILSVSPGTFDTEMGRLEEKSGSMELLDDAAIKRAGRPEEIAELFAFCLSERASYLTGTDILCDGGVVAARMK